MINNINETHAMPFKNVEKMGEVDGVPIYSNEALKKKYLGIISKDENGQMFEKEIRDLVELGIIVPCWSTKGLLSYIFKRFHNRGRVGFFDPSSSKLYILFDEHKFFTGVNTAEIVDTTIHELTHLIAVKTKSEFLNTFEKELAKFYATFFSILFGMKIDAQVFRSSIKIYTYMFKKGELHDNTPKTEFYIGLIKLMYSEFDDGSEFFKNKMKEYVYLLAIYGKYGMEAVISHSNIPKYVYVLKALYQAYDKAYSIDINYVLVQEILYPSEVIAILSSELSIVQHKLKALTHKLL